MVTVNVLVPVIAGAPLSFISMGMVKDFCSSRSKGRSEEMMATPFPLSPPIQGFFVVYCIQMDFI